MTRPFYTDPLAAAWMAKHHGMHFTDIDQLEVFPLHWTSPLLHGVKMYVHPDSLHLLKPQVGDLILDVIGKPFFVAPSSNFDIERIIQRNGIAFIWPEQEP